MMRPLQRQQLSRPSWQLLTALLLLALLLLVSIAHAGDAHDAGMWLLLVPVFLFALVERHAFAAATEDTATVERNDALPSLFERPPPFLA